MKGVKMNKKTCYIYSDDEGSCFAVRERDGKTVATGHMLCILKSDVEAKGYTVTGYPQEDADEEMEYGFCD